MSRHGYVDDCCDFEMNLYRGRVARTIKGRRGQSFLRELAAAMDSMPEKILIAEELINSDGDCCAIGVVCKSRGLDVAGVDPQAPEQVAGIVDISETMAREIEFENDDGSYYDETPEQRWHRMRAWVQRHLITDPHMGGLPDEVRKV